MAMFSTQNPWVFTFGLLGNLVSFVVFLAPIPTFLRIWKKKSTEGFQSTPYVFAMFSAMLWLYYALHKSDAFLLITINSVGCFIETIYIALYLTFAPKKAKRFTLLLLFFLNFVAFGFILLMTELYVKAPNRVTVLGWICVVLAISVFVAPLSIIRLVIRTRSVEFMPFYLSFFLTLSAVMWLFYGLLLKDFYIAVPNILGFVFGILQMLLYVIYKYFVTVPVEPSNKLPQTHLDIIKSTKTTADIEVQQAGTPLPDGQKVADQAEYHDNKLTDVSNGQDQVIRCEV
ncbi:hypothetical protein K2173_027649 [Erythroxylum novogranatense]|uniref:Bidirectional sugar transporter SWEET n=1 Tax=Erythroxylum novogranatense TaxID=1862640 RepID=A0AAV8TZS2_9ROSI|nr:hypothetical protein K2173_027649 [Erythroxylum novogranatense]